MHFSFKYTICEWITLCHTFSYLFNSWFHTFVAVHSICATTQMNELFIFSQYIRLCLLLQSFAKKSECHNINNYIVFDVQHGSRIYKGQYRRNSQPFFERTQSVCVCIRLCELVYIKFMLLLSHCCDKRNRSRIVCWLLVTFPMNPHLIRRTLSDLSIVSKKKTHLNFELKLKLYSTKSGFLYKVYISVMGCFLLKYAYKNFVGMFRW